MQRAVPGQLVASQTTVERAEAQFAIDGLEPFFVKGKAHPIQAAIVGPLVGRRQPGRVTSGDLPLVGRTAELALLHAAVERAALGAGGVIEVRGETGIGKSRLLAELGGQSHSFRVLTGSGNPYAVTMPYGAVRPLVMTALGLPEAGEAELGQLLTQWVGKEAPELVPWLPFLALPLGALVPPSRETDDVAMAFRPTRMVQATVQMLTRALASPTLILIEDAQWLDDRSHALLEAVGSAARDHPWLIVATRTMSTDDEDGQVAALTATTEIIHLHPLEAEHATHLASLAQSTDAPTGSARQRATALKLAERAGGNPLFILELAQVAGGDELPDSVERVVTSRIDTLPATARAWLRDAAVIGQSFELSLLTAARGDAHEGYVAPWTALTGFVDPDGHGSYRFRHAMLHRVAYEGLSYRRRREMHGRAGDAIVARAGGNVEGAAGILSLHYSRAQRHDLAWRFSVMAGKQAGDAYANTEAAEYLRRALDSAAHVADLPAAEKARVAEALGDVCEISARYDDAAGAYGEARRLAAEPAWQVRLMRKEGVLRERRGHYRNALRWYGRGLGAADRPAPEGDEDEAVQLRLAYAGVRYRQARFREVAHLARRAAEAAERLGDRRALAHAFYLLDMAYSALGRPERHEYRGRALPVFEEIGDLVGQANVLNNLGIAAYYEGRWEESLDLYRRSQDARERCGDVVGAAVQANNIAEILSDQGLLEEAEPLFREALASFADAGYELGVASVTGNLGRVAARAGRFDEAMALFDDALERFESMSAGSFVLETHIRRVECLVLAGRCADALIEADQAHAHGGPSDDLSEAALARLRAWALLGCGQPGEAGRSVDAAVALAGAADAPFELALALRARAAMAPAMDPSSGRADTAETDGRQAGELLARLGVVHLPELPMVKAEF
jgi:tetratricopeptide (TPR) repeat protein